MMAIFHGSCCSATCLVVNLQNLQAATPVHPAGPRDGRAEKSTMMFLVIIRLVTRKHLRLAVIVEPIAAGIII